jgi:hypothetical protein
MTMTTSNNNHHRLLLSSLLLLSQASSTTAWGLLHQAFRLGATQLRMAPDDANVNSYRAQLERTYSASELYLDEGGFFDMRHFEDSDFVRKEVIHSINNSNHDDNDGWTAEAMEACGDDCEECLIPEDLKIIPDNSINVMAFLGIRRAEPLKKKMDWD